MVLEPQRKSHSSVDELPEGQPEAHEIPDLPSEIEQEVWDSLKDEFYEQIEQLPLSLHRSFVLIGEQDKEVQACQAELLPTIRSYVKLRQSIQVDVNAHHSGTQGHQHDSSSPCRGASTLASVSSSNIRDPAILTGNPVNFGQPIELTAANTPAESKCIKPIHKEEDLDVTMEDINPHAWSQHSSTNDLCPSCSQHSRHVASTSPDTSGSIDKRSQFAAMRTQSLRETDATVPKSVPFPPRPKRKTTRELLTRISFLTGELLRASEEKVGLATAAYDSVDRYVKALDATIKEREATVILGSREDIHAVRKSIPVRGGSTTNKGVGEDDEEPQLGMVGPAAAAETEGQAISRLRRNRKRDMQRKQMGDGQLRTRVHASSITAQDMPIDPHEPRYCYCNQVSYGEMIACDNPDCIREWFHLGCVGLAAPPKGKVKWYCRDCEEALGRGRRRKVR